jgi:PAS domain-containing protein
LLAQAVGALCLIDNKPGQLKASDLALLEQMARRVAGEIELRRQRSELQAAGAEVEDRLGMLAAAISQMSVGVLLMDGQRKVVVANHALAGMVGRPLAALIQGTGADFAYANSGLFDDPTEYLKKMKLLPEGPYVADEVFAVQRPYVRHVRWMAKPIALKDGQGQLDLFIDLD